jgi:hypothetical protein
VLSQHDGDPPGGAAGDLLDFSERRLGQLVKDERASLGITDVDTVEEERVEVDIESESGVESLYEGDRADLGVGETLQPEALFRAPLERARDLADEHAEHGGSEPPVIAK